MRLPHLSRFRAAFTLVELLVVIVIILLVSAVTLPTVLPALQHQQVSEAARILQAELQRSRDLASRTNVPQGIRFLIDQPLANSNRPVLAYSSFVSIEASPDYSEGTVVSLAQSGGNAGATPGANDIIILGPTTSSGLAPTNWYWNIRLGDKIRFNNSGPLYTIVGPTFPSMPTAVLSSEGFINEGPPGTTSLPFGQEQLWLTNGLDDNGNGYTDEPSDGLGSGLTELETMIQIPTIPCSYVIKRRPAVSPRARIISLPPDVVIDATGYGLPAFKPGTPPDPYIAPAFLERSRLDFLLPRGVGLNAISFGYFDIIFSPNGQVLPNSSNAGPTLLPILPFYHFWLTERDGVMDYPSQSIMPGSPPFLPVQPGAPFGIPTLKGDRRLVTLFTRSGFVVVKQIDVLVDPAAASYDANLPYRDAQAGIKDKL